MSEHSVEELERQLQQALSRKNEADAAFNAAKKRVHEEKCKATGLLGKRVHDRTGRVIAVNDMRFRDGRAEPNRVSGFVVKKNGEIGERYVTVWDWTVIDEATQ